MMIADYADDSGGLLITVDTYVVYGRVYCGSLQASADRLSGGQGTTAALFVPVEKRIPKVSGFYRRLAMHIYLLTYFYPTTGADPNPSKGSLVRQADSGCHRCLASQLTLPGGPLCQDFGGCGG